MPLPAGARDERAVWLRLVLTPGIGPAAVRRLLEAFGLPEDIFTAGRTRLAAALDGARAQALQRDASLSTVLAVPTDVATTAAEQRHTAV